MRVKGKRILKNGTIAGYVYYKKEKKWKWRFISGKKKMKGGEVIEAGQDPVFVGEGNTVIIKGLIDCIGVVIKRKNTNNVVDGIIAGHFVTENMTNIKFDKILNEKTFKLINVKLRSPPEMTHSGMKFVKRMKELMDNHDFTNFDITYFSQPMLAGKYHRNIPYAVKLLNFYLGKGELTPSDSTFTCKV